jgi:hypothetical protein
MRSRVLLPLIFFLGFLGLLLAQPAPVAAATVANPLCPTEVVFFNPVNGEDIVVPPGFTVSAFATGLNFPTGIAFLGNSKNFQVYVLESGHGLPSQCNDETAITGGTFSAANPFTPDILVFDQHGHKIAGPLAKPTSTGGGLQPHGPAIEWGSACRPRQPSSMPWETPSCPCGERRSRPLQQSGRPPLKPSQP